MKTNKHCLLLILMLLGGFIPAVLTAQILPMAASEQDAPILLVGGTIHTGEGEVLENTSIGFDKGVITFIGKASEFDPKGIEYQTIDVTGQNIYPGFILLNSTIGISEITAIPHTNDTVEEGDYHPNLKTVYAFDTGSTFIPTLRFNGILYVESIRSRGVISGTSSVMAMDGWNWEDAVFKEAAAVHLNWPSSLSFYYDQDTNTRLLRSRNTYESNKQQLVALFNDAEQYQNIPDKTTNLKLEALNDLFNGDRVLVIHADEPKEIVESVGFAKSYGIDNISVVTEHAALEVLDFIKKNNVSVILPPTYNLPRMDDMDYDAFYALPKMLHSKGVTVSMYHTGSLSNSMNLAFYAGTSVAFGMEKEEALKMITFNPAKALGIDDRLGSLKVGKVASLFVSQGDALDVQTNVMKMAFIKGKTIDLDGPHQLNYKRYSEKYGHN